MRELNVELEIDAPSSEVWKALSAYGAIERWNPNLSGSRLLQESRDGGVGALRQCDMKDGKNWIRGRVVDWQEGRSYTVDIYEGTMPLAEARATLGVTPQREGRSTAFMRMHYAPKFGAIGAVLDAVMLKSMLCGNMRKVLEGLASHVGDASNAA